MSAARNTPTRPVWLDQYQRDDLTWVADYLRRHGFPDYGNALTKHVAQWDAAPADPYAVATHALATCFDERFGPQALAVLRALGGFPLETT